jgi:hypothetical protein
MRILLPSLLVLVAAVFPPGASQSPARPPALHLLVLRDTVAVCRYPAAAPLPHWARGPSRFLSVTRTSTETSITAASRLIGAHSPCEQGYRPVRVEGELPLDLVGVVASMTGPLAKAGIGIMALSTYETDYVLVQGADLPAARRAWTAAGHLVRDASD